MRATTSTRILLLLTVVTQTATFTSAQNPIPVNPPPLKTFHDPATGLSFDYPSVWYIVPEAESYSPPFLVSRARGSSRPVVTVQFSQQGPYTKTSLEGLIFTYFRLSMKDAQACRDFGALADWQDRHVTRLTIHGVSYTVAQGGEGSAGHGIDATTYVAYRNGTCYAFEADFDTANYTKRSRDLTPSEMRALQRHLDAIMRTVRFDPPAS